MLNRGLGACPSIPLSRLHRSKGLSVVAIKEHNEMNITARPELAAQSLSHIIDPFKPSYVGCCSALAVAKHDVSMANYDKIIAANAERRKAIRYVMQNEKIYLALSSQHKGRGI